MGRMGRLADLGRGFWKHRRRFAPLVLGAAVLVVGGQLMDVYPRQTDIRFELGPDARWIREAQITYIRGNEAVGAVRFPFETGAPPQVVHAVDLPPGRYRVVVELRGLEGRMVNAERTLVVPAEGVVHFRLEEQTRQT